MWSHNAQMLLFNLYVTKNVLSLMTDNPKVTKKFGTVTSSIFQELNKYMVINCLTEIIRVAIEIYKRQLIFSTDSLKLNWTACMTKFFKITTQCTVLQKHTISKYHNLAVYKTFRILNISELSRARNLFNSKDLVQFHVFWQICLYKII